MKKLFAITVIGLVASAASSCSSQQTAWCSLEWPETEKSILSGDCSFEDKTGKNNDATIDFYSKDYSFVFPNSNNGKNYERENTKASVRFSHNDYILTIYPDGKPKA
ncbi:hypothetical protein SynBIOSU31_01768 [Synechococcus sp. BIOS-U3-1]|mgnify:FL=1|uniref:hypothetical protein n=1 Tax=Synechococcus sp. BIOS-U3-1 TaxID=1400865 RepID=UPI001648F195|nr:hypothetical protein [Synechococcus sp. BIOS-U3-1]QNI58637.1 hypothetical protein SynBIOSU31_01768 [Synechococcus sp. BIOS-U3-1]|tara:strand:+ start:2576 stop:2896 length:321 start_codon:yes stop_codon:yes gene_type:complete